jgi:hypothetical protein
VIISAHNYGTGKSERNRKATKISTWSLGLSVAMGLVFSMPLNFCLEI